MPDPLSLGGPITTLTWALALGLSWTGWGFLLARLVYPRDAHRVGWGLLATWGVAVSVAVGGLLNLLGWISPGGNLAFVMAGVFLWGVSCLMGARERGMGPGSRGTPAARKWGGRWLPLALLCLVGGFRTLRVLPWLDSCGFNDYDDYLSYLVFPLKMLEGGHLSADPFNLGQSGSLGGQAFLQSLLLARVPVAQVGVFDSVLCLFLISGLLIGYQRWHRAGAWATATAATLPFFLVMSPPSSAGADKSLMLLYLGLHCTLVWTSRAGVVGPRRWMAVALVGASLVTLKLTALPFAVLLTGVTLVTLRHTAHTATSTRRMLGALAALAVVGVVLVPWTLMTQDWRTLLPLSYVHGLSGTGTRGPTYADWWHVARATDLLAQPLLLVLGGLALTLWALGRRNPDARVNMFGAGATAAGAIALLWAAAGEARYSDACIWASALLLAADIVRLAEHRWHLLDQALQHTSVRRGRRALAISAAGAVIVLTLLTDPTAVSSLLRDGHAGVGRFLRRFTVPVDDCLDRLRTNRDSLRRAQATIPTGQAVAVTLTAPFLLDFGRNDISVIHTFVAVPPDRTGTLPIDERVAAYLLSRNIRYFYTEAGVHLSESFGACQDPAQAVAVIARRHGESGQEAFNCLFGVARAQFRASARGLMQSRHHLYDDGSVVVIDLATRQ